MVAAASKREPPSTGAKNSTLRKTQKENEVAAIYNGRPVNLTAPPIEIYHPVFMKFQHGISLPIDKFSFTAEELSMAMELVTNSLAFYKDEDARIKEITTAMNVPVGEQALPRTEIMRDNGSTTHWMALYLFNARNFSKTRRSCLRSQKQYWEGGSDPIQQAQRDYVLYYSAEDVRCSFSQIFRG